MNISLIALEDLFQATSPFIEAKDIDGLHMSNCYNLIEKYLKALEIVKPLFRLKGNCLQIYCPFADNDDQYMFVKELETEEEINTWKEVLL